MMKKTFFSTAILILLSSIGFTQNNNHPHELCGTEAILDEQLKDPVLKKEFDEANREVRLRQANNKRSPIDDTTLYVIPTVVHVMHLGEPEGEGSNISDAQILSAIDYLNAVYRNDFGQSVDMGIQLCLASVDPDGNPTSGITRTDASVNSDYALNGMRALSQQEIDVKGLSNWNTINSRDTLPMEYYQVWIVWRIAGGASGYEHFNLSQNPVLDGPVVGHDRIGHDPDRSLCFNLITDIDRGSSVLIHELGHTMGLYHSFRGDNRGRNCPTPEHDSFAGDYVDDTPMHIRTSLDSLCDSAAAARPNDCDLDFGGVGQGTRRDHMFNVMDYTSDACRVEFTEGQRTRARDWAIAYRSPFLISTRCSMFAADFIASSTTVCEGDIVAFTDKSSGNTITSWNWSFPGGTPSSSTEQHPVVTYNTPGNYQVQLTVNVYDNNAVETKGGYITVSDDSSICR